MLVKIISRQYFVGSMQNCRNYTSLYASVGLKPRFVVIGKKRVKNVFVMSLNNDTCKYVSIHKNNDKWQIESMNDQERLLRLLQNVQSLFLNS